MVDLLGGSMPDKPVLGPRGPIPPLAPLLLLPCVVGRIELGLLSSLPWRVTGLSIS